MKNLMLLLVAALAVVSLSACDTFSKVPTSITFKPVLTAPQADAARAAVGELAAAKVLKPTEADALVKLADALEQGKVTLATVIAAARAVNESGVEKLAGHPKYGTYVKLALALTESGAAQVP